MFKKLLAYIPSVQSPRPVIECSVALAADLGAQIDAIACGYQPVVADFSFNGAAAVAALAEAQYERALEQATGVLAVFEREAKLLNVQFSSHAFSLLPADIRRMVGEWSRLRDLTIVSQPEPGRSTLDELAAEAALIDSGGPVLIVPYIHQGRLSASRIAICWDGSRPAARAVKDATQFIEQAESVDILAVNEAADATEISSTALVGFLARRNVTATVQRLTADRANIHDILLSAAADCGANLLVMGGYGHSRLRETIFGGVTRGMLQSMPVPVLMSH
jgi:nucleotide-binding universal stress UspA family protein